MKTYFFSIILCIFLTFGVSAQQNMPSVMIYPSDAWCNANGYMNSTIIDGKEIKYADYSKALVDIDFKMVVGSITRKLIAQGIKPEFLENVIKNLAMAEAEDMLTVSKNGAGVIVSPKEKFNARAKPDIFVELTYNFKKNGPETQLTLTIEAIDPHGGRGFSSAGGPTKPSASLSKEDLIEEALLGKMDRFIIDIEKHYRGFETNGKEIVLEIKCFDDWGKEMTDEFEGKDGTTLELQSIIRSWVVKNCVGKNFRTEGATDNQFIFNYVFIPFKDEDGVQMVASDFASKLRSYLKSRYSIEGRVYPAGLGKATLILGTK